MEINKVELRIKGSLSYGNKPNKIIIHHPQFNGTVEELNECMINSGFAMIGYNYYVRKDGSIWGGRPVSAIGANCYGQNFMSIGVSFEGNFMVDVMVDAQFSSGVELLKYLKSTYGISEIGGHNKYYNTECPGRNFPLDRMIGEASSECDHHIQEGCSSIVLEFQKLCNNKEIKDCEGNTLVEDGVLGIKTRSCMEKLPVLKLGSEGDFVSFLQETLNKNGLDLKVDGDFGSITESSVKAFQSSESLDMDGVVGNCTWSALISQ